MKDHWPDKTLSELKEDEDFDHEEFLEGVESVEEQMSEATTLSNIIGTSIILARMVMDDKITFSEYDELTEHVEEYHRECDLTMM